MALVEQSNAVRVVPQIADLHKHPKYSGGRGFFDCKSNGLGGGSESAVSESPTRPARAFGKEEFRSRRIIKVRCSTCRSAFLVPFAGFFRSAALPSAPAPASQRRSTAEARP